MDSTRKLIVGYDLCEDHTQICCYSFKTMEPIPLSRREGEDDCLIPTRLCLKQETKQWLVGEEAVSCAFDKAGVLVDNLFHKVTSGEETLLLGQKYSAVHLLEKYLRKTLILIKNYFPTEQITKLVVTTQCTEPAFVDRIYEALSMLGLEKDRAVVMSHSGVYLYYALNQDKALWMNDVGLFEFSKQGLFYYQLHMNRRTRPIIVGLNKTDYSGQLDITMLKKSGCDPAYIFENVANTALYKQLVTTLYLTGSGFEGNWAEDTIKGLCTGRRVFLGQNLFTKGACYAAKELSGERDLEDFILLDDDMVTSEVSIRVYHDAVFGELEVIPAGKNWYEVNNSIEVIPENTSELELTVKNIMTKEISRQNISISHFPQRPKRMTRLQLQMTCKDKSTVRLTIRDLGFGELYPEEGIIEEIDIEI